VLTRQEEEQEVNRLKEARKLKNTDIWINENFSKATAGIRKSLEEFLCQKLKDEEITVKRDLF